MVSGCDVYVCADNSSVVCAENAVFVPRMRLRKRPRSVDLGLYHPKGHMPVGRRAERSEGRRPPPSPEGYMFCRP